MDARPGKGKRTARLILLIVVVTLIGVGWRAMAARKQKNVVSPLPETSKKQASVMDIFKHKKNATELADKVNDVLSDTLKDYSVYVEDYRSDFVMGLSETEIYTAASVNKLPILAALYYYAQKGTINLDQTITLQQDEIQDYGTGSMRYDQPGTVYSLRTLARLMIKQSDNTASYILANEIIGMDKVQSLVNAWGMTQTDMITNKTSNKDVATLMRKMYDEQIVNHANTQDMLSFLKKTDTESRLPANLPPGVTVYHKVGTDTGEIHDVGIVTDAKHTYYIGVFTNNETDDAATEALIAKVSRVVYDYMQS